MFDRFKRADQAVLLATRTPAEKVRFHIERYDLAIAQCEKGPERLAQLKLERRFWVRVQSAQQEAAR
jgi:ribosomal protein L34E